jgi:hypothetical protein
MNLEAYFLVGAVHCLTKAVLFIWLALASKAMQKVYPLQNDPTNVQLLINFLGKSICWICFWPLDLIIEIKKLVQDFRQMK